MSEEGVPTGVMDRVEQAPEEFAEAATVDGPDTSSTRLRERSWAVLRAFALQHWKGTAVIAVATVLFFLPVIAHIRSYSEGGDAMFNAWTLARDHHCLVRDGCPSYVDGNIFFPNSDTMLYSETQLSAGVLTLPIFFVSKNPILAYNVWTIVSCFLAGWFMYLLAMHLSKGHQLASTAAALVFEFAPFKMAALSHLQNLSIFYLPLAFLLMSRYLERRQRRYLLGLFVALVLQFYASWYQMMFVLVAVAVFLGCTLVLRLARPKHVLALGGVVAAAAVATLPLVREYVRFSRANQATFSVNDQATYASDLRDYVVPHTGTLAGRLYHWLLPLAQPNSYNPDSHSYHGIVLYAVAVALLVLAFRRRKCSDEDRRRYGQIVTLVVLFAVGFVISLGPMLKYKGELVSMMIDPGTKIVVPLPYLLVDVYLPQLSFIRAIGRASVLCLFALCCLLALLPAVLRDVGLSARHRRLALGVVGALIVFELMPIHQISMLSPDTNAYAYDWHAPAVYERMKNDDSIDDIVILAADKDYPNAPIPTAQAEWVLWAGYHNKRVFNGYSGYTPPTYDAAYSDFVDFHADDVPKMQRYNLRYVLVDKRLSVSNPHLADTVASVLPEKVYDDDRYVLFKI
jgi:hypothetical protein